MAHIFFLSDLGEGSVSLARIKGMILKAHPRASFVDISHTVKRHEVTDAGLLLKDTIAYLPEKSIIIAYVDCYYDNPAEYIIVEMQKHIMIGPDNGVLSFALEDSEYRVYHIGNSDYGNWPGRVFAEAAAKVALGFPVEELGEEYATFKKFIPMQPIINDTSIRALIFDIDRYGNLILNVNRETFEAVRKNRRLSIHYQYNNPITFISNQYAEVEVGEILARFNSAGYLEIAVNKSSALDELNLKKNDLIQIDFY